jgi:hypothetical protein
MLMKVIPLVINTRTTKEFFFLRYAMTKVNYSKTCLNLNPNIKHMIIKDKNIKCAKQKFKHNFILIAYENIK